MHACPLFMLTIAWAQFIALVPVVEKADMRNFGHLLQDVQKLGVKVWLYESSHFGAVAVALINTSDPRGDVIV